MTENAIDTLAETHETEFADELIAAFVLYLATLDANQIAAALDDEDDRHIHEQLAIVMNLDGEGVPEQVTTALEPRRNTLWSYVGAIAALAAAQARYTINPRNPAVLTVQATGHAVLDGYLADTGDALATAISRAIYSAGTPESRARQLIRSIGLSAKQAHSLEIMRTAIYQYLDTPKTLIPAHFDETGRRIPPAYVRNINPGVILNPLRGHLSAAQLQIVRKALANPKLTEAEANRILDKHAKAMRNFRARATAGEGIHELTETAKLIGWQVAQRAGMLPQGQRRFWQTAGDERVRHAHSQVPAMNRKGVALNQPFATPFGNFMFPPLEIGCRCKAVLRRTP